MHNHICFVAGASGGHIVPALTLAQQELQKNTSTRVTFFSTHALLDKKLLTNIHGIEHIPLPLGPLPAKKMWLPWWLLKALFVTIQIFWWIIRVRPRKVVSTGGIISLPVCLAAMLARVPFDIYELNALPGKAVLFLAPYACTLFTVMPSAHTALRKYACTMAPYPLRYVPHDKVPCGKARAMLGLYEHLFTILVVGGSQGSQSINELIQQYSSRYQQMRKKPWQIIHQAGEHDVITLRRWYEAKGIEALVFSYRADIALCYSAADCIIARAGAGTLFELQFFEKPSIIIPLETRANHHQVDNAYEMAILSPHIFHVIRHHELLRDPSLLDNHIDAVGQLSGLPPKTA